MTKETREQFTERHLSQEGRLDSLKTLVDQVQSSLHAKICHESAERGEYHSILQSNLESNVHAIRASIQELDTQLKHQIQQVSDDRQKDKYDIERRIHNCIGMLLSRAPGTAELAALELEPHGE